MKKIEAEVAKTKADKQKNNLTVLKTQGEQILKSRSSKDLDKLVAKSKNEADLAGVKLENKIKEVQEEFEKHLQNKIPDGILKCFNDQLSALNDEWEDLSRRHGYTFIDFYKFHLRLLRTYKIHQRAFCSFLDGQNLQLRNTLVPLLNEQQKTW